MVYPAPAPWGVRSHAWDSRLPCSPDSHPGFPEIRMDLHPRYFECKSELFFTCSWRHPRIEGLCLVEKTDLIHRLAHGVSSSGLRRRQLPACHGGAVRVDYLEFGFLTGDFSKQMATRQCRKDFSSDLIHCFDDGIWDPQHAKATRRRHLIELRHAEMAQAMNLFAEKPFNLCDE